MKNLRRGLGALSSAALLGSVLVFMAGAGTATAANAAPQIFNPPRIPTPAPGTPGGPAAPGGPGGPGVTNTWAASNWSGYAETGTFTGVSGTWTVPSVAASSSATYSSAWIGVDGFNNSNLIQTGTEEDFYNGAAHYNAWWEILPAAETALPGSYAVGAGDRMKASIYETSSTTGTSGPGGKAGPGGKTSGSKHVWVITITDTTRGWTYTTNQAYNGTGTSAEWVMEAPQVGGRIATLAHYSFNPPTNTGDFDNAGVLKTVVSSGSPAYTGAALNYQNDAGVMIQNKLQVSTPGNPDGVLTAFNAAYGSVLPSTPTG